MHPRVPFILLTLLLPACAVSVRGLVGPGPDGVELRQMTGRTRELRLESEQARLLRFLDGEEVEVHGRSAGGTIRVQRWELREGTHGLQVFWGTLVDHERGVGVQDRGSQAFYTIDKDAADALVGALGKPVLIEGYVEGARAVRVVYYRVLAAPEAAP